jgi:hypothetical protein
MKWTVAWRRSARDDLAAMWVDAHLRAEITNAANRIDYLLTKDPLAVGESRDEDRHILIEAPLAVLFKIKPAEQKVVVTRVWRTS